MKHLFTLFITLFVINIGTAQEEIPKIYVKWVPTSLLSPFAKSIQFSLERFITPKYAFHYGLGYVTDSNIDSNSNNPINGYRSRFGFRMYQKGLRPMKLSFFHGPTFIARQVFQEDEQAFCITSNCILTSDARFVHMQTRVAITYGCGWHFTTKEGLSLELEILNGVRYLKSRKLGLPPLTTLPASSFFPLFNFPDFDGDGIRPAFHVLLRVGLGFSPKS